MTRRVPIAMDRQLVGFDAPGLDRTVMAFDRESVRTTSEDGHLHVGRTHISKAAINPYRGAEIPHHAELGLDPDRIYKLYRDPDELKKGAPSFNRLPLLSEHSPINADSHDHAIVVGSTGESATYDHPYLDNGLVVWSRGAIDGIEGGSQKELSAAYRYRADMTPGEVDDQKFDGVMRDIRGSHVAIVKKGRAGPDVVVGDSALQTTLKEKFAMMRKSKLTALSILSLGAAMATLGPSLAMDSKVNLTAPFKGVNKKNFDAKKIALAIRPLIDGKLAQDTDLDEAIEGVTKILDAIGETDVADVVEQVSDPADDRPPGGSADAGLPPAAVEFLQGVLSEEQLAQLMEMMGSETTADDESPEAKKKREEKEAAEKKDKDEKGKQAMDAAISTAVTAAVSTAETRWKQESRDLSEAREMVRPYVGAVPLALDSAETIFRHTLKALSVDDHATMPAAALKAVLKAQPIPGTNRRSNPVLAADSAETSKSFFERFPGSDKIAV